MQVKIDWPLTYLCNTDAGGRRCAPEANISFAPIYGNYSTVMRNAGSMLRSFEQPTGE